MSSAAALAQVGVCLLFHQTPIPTSRSSRRKKAQTPIRSRMHPMNPQWLLPLLLFGGEGQPALRRLCEGGGRGGRSLVIGKIFSFQLSTFSFCRCQNFSFQFSAFSFS